MRRAENAIEKTGGRPRRSDASGTPGRRLGARNGRRNDFCEIFCETTLRIGPSASCGKNPHEKKNRYLDRYVLRRDGRRERASDERPSAREPSTRRRRNIFFSGSFFLRRFDCAKSVQTSKKVPRARFRRPTPRGRPDASGPSRRLGAVPTPRGRRLGARNGRRNDF